MKIKAAVQALTSLAHPSRLEVFRLLVRSERLRAGELAEAMKVPKPTLSFHLKELSRAGLIESERSGRTISYGVCAEGFRQLIDFLSQDCCQGRPELCLPTLDQRDETKACC